MNDAERHSLFGRWLAEHPGILHHVAHGFAGAADRDDLMQELLLALWRALPAFRGDSKASTFIYRVAHNTALTWKRSQRGYLRRLERFEKLAAPAETNTSAPGSDHERLQHVYRAVRELPPLDRSLVLLHLDGLSYAEIGEIHGLSEGNVGVRLTRSKNKLIHQLQTIAHELS